MRFSWRTCMRTTRVGIVKWIEEHPHQNPERDPILDILPKGAFRVIKDVSDQLMDLKSS